MQAGCRLVGFTKSGLVAAADGHCLALQVFHYLSRLKVKQLTFSVGNSADVYHCIALQAGVSGKKLREIETQCSSVCACVYVHVGRITQNIRYFKAVYKYYFSCGLPTNQ